MASYRVFHPFVFFRYEFYLEHRIKTVLNTFQMLDSFLVHLRFVPQPLFIKTIETNVCKDPLVISNQFNGISFSSHWFCGDYSCKY